MSETTGIIDRHSINENLTLKILDKNLSFTRSELVNLIDRAKTYLLEEIKVTPGQQVIITFGNYYVPWFYACAELGLVFVIAASHKVLNYKLLNDRYGKIDHVIMPFDKEDLKEFGKTYQNILIDANSINTYTNVSSKDVYWANPNSVLTRSISDKFNLKLDYKAVEEHTHSFYYRLMLRNGNVFALTTTDKCFHTRILHHGTSLGLYFLPAFKFCETQYWCDDTDPEWPNFLVENHATRCIMFEEMLSTFIEKTGRTSLAHLKIYLLLSPSYNEVECLVKNRHASLYSLYGMTSTSGPIFIQETTPGNCHLYNRHIFSDLLDDFYSVEIKDNMLVVTYDDTVVYTKDQFEYKNGKYNFLFRGNMIIGICGFIGSGKDTVADYLVNFHGFRRESFANSLKDAVSAIFGWDRTLLEGRTAESRAWREQKDEWWSERLGMTITPRFVLQNWGTEILRNQFHNDIWIASVENKLRNSKDNIVITDCRFPNEIKAIKAAGGTVVRTKRGNDPEWYQIAYNVNTGKVGEKLKLVHRNIHESEMAWIGPDIDAVIENDSTIDELYSNVKCLVQDLLDAK